MAARKRKWTPALEDEIRRRTYSGQASIFFDAEGNVEVTLMQGFQQAPKPAAPVRVDKQEQIFNCDGDQFTIDDALDEVE